MSNYAAAPANIQDLKNEHDSFSRSNNSVNQNNTSFGATGIRRLCSTLKEIYRAFRFVESVGGSGRILIVNKGEVIKTGPLIDRNIAARRAAAMNKASKAGNQYHVVPVEHDKGTVVTVHKDGKVNIEPPGETKTARTYLRNYSGEIADEYRILTVTAKDPKD